MSQLLKKITPVGKLVRFENLSLVADISQRAGSWDINELYHPTGAKVEDGDPLGEDRIIFNTELYDEIYSELDQDNFYDIKPTNPTNQKSEKIENPSLN